METRQMLTNSLSMDGMSAKISRLASEMLIECQMGVISRYRSSVDMMEGQSRVLIEGIDQHSTANPFYSIQSHVHDSEVDTTYMRSTCIQ